MKTGSPKLPQKTNAAIAKDTYRAYVRKDRAAIEALIADDFHFTSPLDNRIDRATYFERCWPNSEAIADFEFVRVAEDGDQVFVTYEGRASTGNRFRNTEILTVRDGRVVEAEVYFGWNLPHEAPEGGFVEQDK
jgi:ketosteroid isomerase-like protein